jgi:DNA-binding NarL/FixJ family response regulator
VAKRVLIVDDHAGFRGFAKRLLDGAGFLVVGEAEEGATAVREAARLRPDVVLLDIMLPDRSGLLVAEDLARNPSPPIVVLVSSRSRADFGLGFEWPAGSVFLPKHQLSASMLNDLLVGLA